MVELLIKLNKDQDELVSEVANIKGITKEDVMKWYNFEDMEDIVDARDGDEALKEFYAGDMETVSFEELYKHTFGVPYKNNKEKQG